MSFIAIGLSALIRSTVSSWWAEYKKRHQTDAITMTERNGVWQPSRLIPRVERVIDWVSYFGIVCLALSAAFAIYWAIAKPA